MASQRPALLVLGGFASAWNQRFLQSAQRRELAVLVMDSPGPHVDTLVRRLREPTHDSALAAISEAAVESASDLATIVDQVASWARRYSIRGVCCIREEHVEACSVIADMLDVPSPGLRAARVSRSKCLQRRYLAEWGPRSTPVQPGRHADVCRQWTRFPMVVKPSGRFASSGVRLVSNHGDLLSCLAQYGEDETLLFEERGMGQEYSVESLTHDGTLCFAEITEKLTTEAESPFFVEMTHTTPSPHISRIEREHVLAVHRAVLSRLQFSTGMAHAEYRVSPAGGVVLMEIAVRPPGDSIMALHWLASGTPLEDAVVGLAVGETVCYPQARRIARQVYLPHQPGVLEDVTVHPGLGVVPTWFDPAEVRAQVSECGAASDPPTVRCLVALKPVGAPIGPLRESSDRVAMFVIDAATSRELDELEIRCRAAIDVRVRQ